MLCKQHKDFIEVFEGTNKEWAKKQGFYELEVEKGFDGQYYLKGKAPKESEESKTKKEVLELERQTGYTRVLREIISKTDVSKEIKDVAENIEKIAIKLRK